MGDRTHGVLDVDSQRNGENEQVDCNLCNRNFRTNRGLIKHLITCRKKNNSNPIEAEPRVVIVDANHEQLYVSEDDIFRQDISSAYESPVKWRKNLFELPKGSVGKSFIDELTKLINRWSSKSPDRDVCIKALMVMPTLILQRTSIKCKSAQIKEHIQRRLKKWINKDIQSLLDETRTLQDRLPNTMNKPMTNEELSKRFSRLMLEGKVNPAIRLLNNNVSGGVLPLTEEVLANLRAKHPEGSPINETMALQGPLIRHCEVIYDEINANLIRSCTIRTKGSHGPSGLDSDFWNRLVCNRIYGTSSDDLCHAIALMTRQLCIENITDPESLEALLACRLIPLDKCPGIRPIGIGEVLRRIMGKAVMSILRPDVLKSTGYQQMCAGQEAGCEVAIHAVRDLYDLDSTHGFIQIDASNAFNSINRNVLLHNIKIICPQIATYVTNCYNKPARLFITGGKEIQSTEGTTQGDPIAMGMYALGLMPLLTSITTPENK